MSRLPGNTRLYHLGREASKELGIEAQCDAGELVRVLGFRSRQLADYHSMIVLGKLVWLCREAWGVERERWRWLREGEL